jgi:hypothetical protein
MARQMTPKKLRKRYGHMPASAATIRSAISLAPWVNDLDDACLYEVVVEALTARVSAERRGGNPSAIAAGDVALDLIRTGRVHGDQACKKAAVALRKYTRSYGGVIE